jgi:hypothetical protein
MKMTTSKAMALLLAVVFIAVAGCTEREPTHRPTVGSKRTAVGDEQRVQETADRDTAGTPDRPDESEIADDADAATSDEAQPEDSTEEAVESSETEADESASVADSAEASAETAPADAETALPEETVETETETNDDLTTEEPAEEDNRIEISGIIERSDSGLVLVSDFGDYLMAGKGIAGMIGKEVEVVGTVVDTDDGLKINVISISPVK